ncbi:MAG: hypothetical protein AAF716_02505 [Cyanobacteria bacterium P01_D01_bin.1]
MAIASATGLIPFASESAIALPSAEAPRSLFALQQAPSSSIAQDSAATAKAQAIAPQVDQIQQASFSQTPPLASSTRQSAAAREDENGNWSLAYATQTNTPQANNAVQTVIAQIAAESARAQACKDSVCRQLAYVDSQLPRSAEKIQRLEKQLNDFSRQYAQGDMSAYRTVLSDRILEVSEQKRQLAIELDQTRLLSRQLRTRLSLANVEADIAERILAKDTDYQTLWDQLKAVETNIQKEYAQVNIDGTALNQLYADYQELLGKTQVAAQVALSRYSSIDNSLVARSGYRVPTETKVLATEMLANLVLETHQQNVQQLRTQKIAIIEAELLDRHRRLSEQIGEYERLQRELNSEQKLVESYRLERNQILAKSSTLVSDGSNTPNYNSQSLLNARALLPMLPNGSVAKSLLGVAIASSLVATMTHRSSQRKAAVLGKRILEIIPANSPLENHITSQPQKIPLPSAEKIQTKITKPDAGPQVADSEDIEVPISRDSLELILTKEGVRTEKPSSFCIVNDRGEFEISEGTALSLNEVVAEIERDKLLADIEAATFNEALKNLTPEDLFTQEVNSSEIAPIRLPVSEIDSFVEIAVEWVLKDLGLDPSIADTANRIEVAAAS